MLRPFFNQNTALKNNVVCLLGCTVTLYCYSVLSDDRSVDVFRNKIESATQMQSVLDSGKRPNCLIIDEIDGAPTVSTV